MTETEINKILTRLDELNSRQQKLLSEIEGSRADTSERCNTPDIYVSVPVSELNTPPYTASASLSYNNIDDQIIRTSEKSVSDTFLSKLESWLSFCKEDNALSNEKINPLEDINTEFVKRQENQSESDSFAMWNKELTPSIPETVSSDVNPTKIEDNLFPLMDIDICN